MVFYINKQAVELKSYFDNAPLTSPNECCCAVGILAKIYDLSLPEKFDTVEVMRKDIHNQIDHKPIPSDYAGKVIQLLDGYFKPADIDDELYELMKYAYEDQKGKEPSFQPSRPIGSKDSSLT